jgi:hypothetical protein
MDAWNVPAPSEEETASVHISFCTFADSPAPHLRLPVQNALIGFRPRAQVTVEEMAHVWLRIRWEQSDPQPSIGTS